ncbi:10128_t:CDS:2 [Scutellospora calospora]|uniref:10128_t:CDS:1 n=1 Tax=Scutellospora calospora TaxID=85575 RepID=A0ACA9KG17_9GLOM|nr:10128_t:CDS:2 [Scutellospora calospora]
MFCFTDLITDLCECDINIKPSRVKTNSQQIYSRIYDPYNTSSNQKQLLQCHDRIYAYCCDFNTSFNLTFCFACHSQYERIKNSENAGTSDGDDDSNYGDDVSVSSKKSSSCLQLKAKDEDDYDAFINESKKLKKSSKDMVLYITLKSDIKKRKKKVKDSSIINVEDSDSNEEKPKTKKAKKSNRLPKEERLSSNEVELANIITQLRSKYQCGIHNTPCYIEDSRHLPLNPACLHLWSRDIKMNVTDLDTPPTYPSFGLDQALKPNTQISQS